MRRAPRVAPEPQKKKEALWCYAVPSEGAQGNAKTHETNGMHANASESALKCAKVYEKSRAKVCENKLSHLSHNLWCERFLFEFG